MKIQTVDDYIEEQGNVKKEMQHQFSEWQLCPKCNGEGIVFSTSYGTAGNVTRVCGVCNGEKILARPIIK